MTFDPAWFAAILSTGAMIMIGYLSSRLRKLESRLSKEREDGTLPLPSNGFPTFEEFKRWQEPPGTRMPEMEERK